MYLLGVQQYTNMTVRYVSVQQKEKKVNIIFIFILVYWTNCSF